MAYQIIYKKRFVNKLDKLITYLQTEWNNDVVSDFLEVLLHKIEIVKANPSIGIKTSISNVHSILITKHNRIYYRIESKNISILNLIDTRIKPSRNPYKKLI